MGIKLPRVRLIPQLSSIQLDDVLSGETCEPISLTDFEFYLMHKEHSVENLRFIVWYQSYRRRFFALPASQQKLSPGPNSFNFALPTPARTAERISRVSTQSTFGSSLDEPTSPTSLMRPPSSLTSLSPLLSRLPSVHLTTLPSPNSRAPMPAPPEIQPFRHECTLVTSTFLHPSAPYELSLPSLLLSTILRDLTVNTHPDVFLPAYEFAYEALLTHSLPCFLDSMQYNMNWEKRMYWWLYGVLTTCIGWAITIGCLFIHYGPNTSQGRLRAWRLLGVPFFSIGAMQMYSAYRGFCSQIWGRGATQLRPWELVSPPASSEAGSSTYTTFDRRSRRTSTSSSGSRSVEAIQMSRRPYQSFEPSSPPTVSEAQSSLTDKKSFVDIDIRDVVLEDSLPSPLSMSSHRRPTGLAPIITDGYRDTWDDLPSPHQPPTPLSPLPPGDRQLRHYGSKLSILSKKSRDAPYVVPTLSTRVKVFGPERVVLDPRIRAVHRRVMRDILVAGFVVGTILTVVVVALPHGR